MRSEGNPSAKFKAKRDLAESTKNYVNIVLNAQGEYLYRAIVAHSSFTPCASSTKEYVEIILFLKLQQQFLLASKSPVYQKTLRNNLKHRYWVCCFLNTL